VADDNAFGFSEEARNLIRREVALKRPLLDKYSDEQLLAEISPFRYGSQIEEEEPTTTGPGAVAIPPLVPMPQAGSDFLEGGTFHRVICEDENREMIKELLAVFFTADVFTQLVTVILAPMGITNPIVVPTAVVALALILFRRGIDSYCQ
jgi:hypothetical protein